jgi:RHO1 GDP-GTP exchange protein 1/2
MRARPELLINWSGNPTFFSFSYPYIIAFDPSFIEIRNVDTGLLQQVIHTPNLKVLSTDPSLMDCVMDGDGDLLQVFRLKLLAEMMPHY